MMKGLITAAVLGAALIAGCHEPVAPTEPTSARVDAPNEAEFDRLWEAALTVLRKHYFSPARRDRRAGVITTHPTTAENFFEFWRDDTVGSFEKAEANLHTIRKYVTLRLSKTDNPGMYGLQVEVQSERLDQPERQITSASAALRAFSAGLPTTEGQPTAPETWVPLGRDAKLEQYLLGKILTRYGQPVGLNNANNDSTSASAAKSPESN
jgi:hypothetical protein